jgi:hypothetical protein
MLLLSGFSDFVNHVGLEFASVCRRTTIDTRGKLADSATCCSLLNCHENRILQPYTQGVQVFSQDFSQDELAHVCHQLCNSKVVEHKPPQGGWLSLNTYAGV